MLFDVIVSFTDKQDPKMELRHIDIYNINNYHNKLPEHKQYLTSSDNLCNSTDSAINFPYYMDHIESFRYCKVN